EWDARIVDPFLHFGDTFLLKVLERHDDVRDLNAGVVDVVLRLDVVSEPFQTADQRVAENSVADVADVCRLVWIDVRVLHDDALARRPRQRHDGADMRGGEASPIETKVEVSTTLHRDGSNEHRQRKISDQ